MDTKRIVPAVTAAFLGAVWVWMEYQHLTPPQALNQALIGAIGATFAVGAIPKKEVPNEA